MADHEKCGGCGAVLASPIESQKVRVPCTACGSVLRMIEVSANDTLEVHESLAFKQKGIGHKKPTVEGVGGDEFFRKEQKWVSKVRLIDREANRYQEKVTDPATGRIIRECDEPLDQHIGHGSAKA